MAGLFVTFEGGEGSGKSTQIARLSARLEALGETPLVAREPGGTTLAEGIRTLLMNPGQPPHPVAEALLMEAARADLVASVLRPALDAGRTVLCDRYTDSTLAYQGAGRGLARADLEAWNRAATAGLVPDATLLFDLDPEIGIERRSTDGGMLNRFDRESLEFHRRVRACYLELAAADPRRIVVLDANRPPEALELEVWKVVDARRRARSAGGGMAG